MNPDLKAFLLGFGLGAMLGLIVPELGLIFGSSLLVELGSLLAVGLGVLFGILAVVMATIYRAVPREVWIILAVGVLVIGLVTFQPEIDAAAFLALALPFVIPKAGEED